MARFLHTADWQVGMKGGGLGEAGPLVARERLDAIDRLLGVAVERGVDFVLAAGDLLEDHRLAGPLLESLAEVLGQHTSVPVHIIPGNHDLCGPHSAWRRAPLRNLGHVHVHDRAGSIALEGGVTLHAFPVTSRYAAAEPLASLPDCRALEGIHVGMAHGHLTTHKFGGHEEEVTLPLDVLEAYRAGLDYLALGHWHGMRLVPGPDGVVRVAYSGTPEQTHHRERDAGYVLEVDIAGKGAPPNVTPHRVGRFVWERRDLHLVGDEDLERLQDLLEVTADFLVVTLTGELPLVLQQAYRELMQRAASRFLHFRLRDQQVAWRVDAVSTELPNPPILKEVWQRLQEHTPDEVDPRVLLEAQRLFQEILAEGPP